MAKEIYLYNPIYSFVAEELMQEMNANMSEEIVLRLNTPGGSVFSGYGLCSKMTEHGNVTIKVDGYAASMGAFMLLFANKVECSDVSKIMLHRADGYAETDAQKEFLASVNKDLRAKLEKKINADTFKEVTGVSFDEMFASDKRIDVWIDAKQAKKLGLVDKINKLDPKELKALSSAMMNIAASFDNSPKNEQVVTIQNPIKMTIEKLKAENPEVFAQILALGVNAEKERVKTWMVFADVDAVAVKAGIDSGKEITASEQADFNRKAFSATALKSLEDNSPEAVKTEEAPATPEASETANFENQVNALLGLTK